MQRLSYGSTRARQKDHRGKQPFLVSLWIAVLVVAASRVAEGATFAPSTSFLAPSSVRQPSSAPTGPKHHKSAKKHKKEKSKKNRPLAPAAFVTTTAATKDVPPAAATSGKRQKSERRRKTSTAFVRSSGDEPHKQRKRKSLKTSQAPTTDEPKKTGKATKKRAKRHPRGSNSSSSSSQLDPNKDDTTTNDSPPAAVSLEPEESLSANDKPNAVASKKRKKKKRKASKAAAEVQLPSATESSSLPPPSTTKSTKKHKTKRKIKATLPVEPTLAKPTTRTTRSKRKKKRRKTIVSPPKDTEPLADTLAPEMVEAAGDNGDNDVDGEAIVESSMPETEPVAGSISDDNDATKTEESVEEVTTTEVVEDDKEDESSPSPVLSGDATEEAGSLEEAESPDGEEEESPEASDNQVGDEGAVVEEQTSSLPEESAGVDGEESQEPSENEVPINNNEEVVGEEENPGDSSGADGEELPEPTVDEIEDEGAAVEEENPGDSSGADGEELPEPTVDEIEDEGAAVEEENPDDSSGADGEESPEPSVNEVEDEGAAVEEENPDDSSGANGEEPPEPTVDEVEEKEAAVEEQASSPVDESSGTDSEPDTDEAGMVEESGAEDEHDGDNIGSAEAESPQTDVEDEKTEVESIRADSETHDSNEETEPSSSSSSAISGSDSIDPEQDVVSFIEDVLQEDVRSWIDDTSTDSHLETVVNKTRGGQIVDLATQVEEEEVVDPESNDQGEDESSTPNPTTEEIVEVPMDRESLQTLGDKDSDAVVSVVTWNLAEDSPTEEDAAFIRKFRENGVAPGQGSELVLISGQECENIKPRRSEGRRSREYRRLMIKMLGREYVPLALHLLGGIQFGLFAKRSFLKEIEDISVADVTCGIGNVFHNKGAIAAFVTLKARNEKNSDTKRSKSLRMVFVTAHLAAHVKNAGARDSDFWRISSELEAQAPEGFLPRKGSNEGAEGSFLFDSVDRVFFCGDLNYRLDLPRESTEHSILHGPKGEQAWIKDLLKHDQLIHSMSGRRAFPAFGEGKISFLPTFKYDKESESYDTSHKQRIPAWTDRILFQPTEGIRVLDYQSVPEAQSSDHRPVYGAFRIGMEGRVIPQSVKRRKRKRLEDYDL